MPDGVMSNIGQGEQQQQQELITRLLGRIAQPRMEAPQPPPQAQQSLQQPPPIPHMLTRGVLGLVHDMATRSKKAQLDHATQRLLNLGRAVSAAYDMAQGDPDKAHEYYKQSVEYQSMVSKEGQKDMKQMEKLAQWDFLNPDKNKTVWHEALGKAAQIMGAEKVMQGIKMLMGKHKDKMAEDVKKQGEAQHKQEEARSVAETAFRAAKPEQIDPSKSLPSLISSTGADIRQREKEYFADYERQQKQEFTKLIDSNPEFNKNPILRQVGKGINAALQGDDEEANKYFSLASKASAATQKPGTMNLNKAITDLSSDDPKAKEAAQKWVDNYQRIQKSILMDRGLSFGMGRLYNWYNAETGETMPMNGFQVQQAMQRGEQWIMTSPISPQQLLPAQQIVRSMNVPDPSTGKNLREELVGDMAAFDNASDRAIISRVLRENPSAYAQDPSTLGIWLDQNLTDKLSEGGQKLVRDLKLYAEVFNRTASLTGQTRTEMNTMMLLALLPNERTPGQGYGMQQLQSSFNYLDGMVQAPLLGGAKFKGGAAPKAAAPKAEAAKPSEPAVIDLDKPN